MWNGSSCLFVWFDSFCPSPMSGPVFLGWTSIKQANVSNSRTQRSNDGETRIRNPSVLSQALYHRATAFPWNGSGRYGFIRAILSSTTGHFHAIGNIHYESIILLESEASPAVHQGFVSSIATLYQSPLFSGDWSWKQVYVRSPRSADSRRVLGSFKWKYVQKDLFIPLFYTGPESHDSPRIDKYLDSWLKRTQFAKILTRSYSP